MFTLLLASIVVFGLALVGLATGVLLSGRCLRSSCGGEGAVSRGEEGISCAGCRRNRAAQEGSTLAPGDGS